MRTSDPIAFGPQDTKLDSGKISKMNRTQSCPYVQYPLMSRTSIAYAHYINVVQYVLILKCHLAEKVFFQINVIKKEAQYITLCNTADLLLNEMEEGRARSSTWLPLYCIYFQGQSTQVLSQNQQNTKKKKKRS